MNSQYVQGAGWRARKLDMPGRIMDPEWERGYNEMNALLTPIEQEIVLATFKYQTTAQNRMKELMEESTRAQAVASSATGSTGSGQ